MSDLTNLGKGLIIIQGLHLKRKPPAFRNDYDYEDFVMKVCSEYIEHAIEKKYAVLFLDDCLKSVTVKQALMLMQYKAKIPLFVHASHQHSINPALIDMHCIEVLTDDVYKLGGKILSFCPDTKADKYLLNLKGQFRLNTINGQGVCKSFDVPTALSSIINEPPAALVVNGNVSCNQIESSIDLGLNVVETPIYSSIDEKHFEFTTRLRELTAQRNAAKRSSGLEGLIHSLEMGDAKDRIIALYEHVSSEANLDSPY